MTGPVRYVSTRGAAPPIGFTDVVLAGLAPDGGLYVPESWPVLDDDVLADRSRSYAELAASVMAPFAAPDTSRADLLPLAADAYAGFRHPDVASLVEIGDGLWLQELFHGPTLAFKDVALQFLGRLFDRLLAASGERLTIVGATSGDTGSAAIDGLRHCRNVDVVILYPAGRVSEVQRRQMTTVDSPNVRAVAIDGTFDDCQDLVKAMFADVAFREGQRLSAVNSINWARVMAQVVYYVDIARRIGTLADVSVPTGNFGNVLSGWIAKRAGANLGRLVVASNSNDILARFLATRTMAVGRVAPTLSPSMDIQVSSNFERLLFEIDGRDGTRTAARLAAFRETGSLAVTDAEFERWISPTFVGARCSDDETLAEIARVHAETGMLIDPHTAVGVGVARRSMRDGVPMVALATAHPAKFPDAVERATGVRPELPEHLADLFDRPERFVELPNDLAAVQRFVAAR